MGIITKIALIIFALLLLASLWITIMENEKLQIKNKQLCAVSNQMVDTVNMESNYINKYCGSDSFPLPNVSYVECEE